MKRIFLFLALVSLLAACGPAGVTAPQQPLPTAAQEWTSIKMTHSGGIMGVMRVIEISRDGALTVTDDRTKDSLTRQLTADELAELSALIAGFTFRPPSKPSACADCFNYTIEITRANVTSLAEADDISLADSGLEPLVTFLRALTDQALR